MYLLAFLVIIAFNGIHILQGEQTHELPSIWSEIQEDGRGYREQSYRFLGEIQLLGSSKWYLAEEWASTTREKFRLDLVESPTNERRTLLAYYKTGENFSYQPFTCKQVNNLSEALFPEFSGVFPTSSRVAPIGIGAIWLYALKLKSKHTVPCSCKINDKNRRTGRRCSQCFSSYKVNSTEEYKFGLKFLFRKSSTHDEAKTLAFIQVIDTEENKVVMRIKMLELERTPLGNDDKLDSERSEVFELPEGYGCERGAQFEHSFSVPIDVLGSRLVPHILKLDIVSLQASSSNENDVDHVEKWKTHSISVRMVAGRLSLSEEHKRDYLILEIQDYAPELEERVVGEQKEGKKCGTSSSSRRTSLRRLKWIWELGSNGLEPDNGSETRPVYFKLDVRNGRCLGYGRTDSLRSASIEFPLSSCNCPQRLLQDAFSSASASSTSSCSQSSFQLTGLTLNSKLLERLFASSDEFHLIKERSAGSMQEYVYEQRIANFEIRNQEGKLTWSGPVSMIRKQTLCVTDWIEKSQSPLEIKTSVTILFLSSSLNRIVGKIFISLGEKKNINEAAFHRELNVASCYAAQMIAPKMSSSSGTQTSSLQPYPAFFMTQMRMISSSSSSGSGRRARRRSRRELDIILSYPIESSSSSSPVGCQNESEDKDESACQDVNGNSDMRVRLLANQAVEALIYEQFLKSIYRVSEGQFDTAMQLTEVNLEVNIEQEILKISARLLERPSLLAYNEQHGLRFGNDDDVDKLKGSSIFIEFKADREACAESCNQLNCSRFVYCDNNESKWSRECYLDLAGSRDKSRNSHNNKELEPELDKNCSLFTGEKSVGMSSLELVHRIEELLKIQTSDSPFNPLAITLDFSEESIGLISLTPSRLESSLDDETSEEENKSNLLLKAEFELISSHRSYKLNDPSIIQQVSHLSEEECETHCEQFDCLSFSYCQLEKTCLLSNLHESKSINSASEQADLCFILARDYLSKFIPALQLNPGTKLTNIKSVKTVESVRDCAINCMSDEQRNFNCHSFYFCPDSGQCYLSKTHLTTSSGSSSNTSSDYKAIEAQTSCHLYMRSYLDDFDRFYGKSVSGKLDGIGQRTVMLPELGAESCALECAQHESICTAFQECRSRSGTPICALVLGTSLVIGEQLIEDEQCTVFSLSSSSELFLRQQLLLSLGKEAKTSNLSRQTSSSLFHDQSLLAPPPSSSNPLVLVLLPLGVAIGYTIAAAIERAKRMKR